MIINTVSISNTYGLFGGVVNGSISNLTVNSATITIGDSTTIRSSSNVPYTGIIVGQMSSGTITNYAVHGTIIINKESSYTGGIVGQLAEGSVTNCRNYCIIYSYGTVGGIVGKLYDTVTSCTNYGDLTYKYAGDITSLYISVDFTDVSVDFTDMTPKVKTERFTLRPDLKDTKCLY